MDRLAGEPIAVVDLEAISARGRRRRKDDDPAVARDRHLAGIGQVAGQQRGPSEIPLAYVDVAGEVRVARRQVRPEGDERDHVAVGGDGRRDRLARPRGAVRGHADELGRAGRDVARIDLADADE